MITDYSKYSAKSLLEARAFVDDKAYPHVAEAIDQEMDSRREEVLAFIEQKRTARRKRMFWFKLILAIALVAFAGFIAFKHLM